MTTHIPLARIWSHSHSWVIEAVKYYPCLADHVLSPNLEIQLVKEEGENGYWETVSRLCYSGLFPEDI